MPFQKGQPKPKNAYSWQKGHPAYTSGMLGKHHSIATRRKIALAVSGERNGNYGKPSWNKGLKIQTNTGRTHSIYR